MHDFILFFQFNCYFFIDCISLSSIFHCGRYPSLLVAYVDEEDGERREDGTIEKTYYSVLVQAVVLKAKPVDQEANLLYHLKLSCSVFLVIYNLFMSWLILLVMSSVLSTVITYILQSYRKLKKFT